MKDQKELIYEFIDQDRFMLIILDACRFDALKHIYGDQVQCVRSAGLNTQQWFKNVWNDKYDLTYFSSAPMCGHTDIKGYLGTDHFEVVEVWDIGWNEELGTVPPEAMVKAVKVENVNKMVVHFMQPHAPYIGEYSLKCNELGENKVARLAKKHGDEAVRKAYFSNLMRAVNEGVNPLAEWFDGPIVITADHGESLGENGNYGHNRPDCPALRNVPWYKYNRVVKNEA